MLVVAATEPVLAMRSVETKPEKFYHFGPSHSFSNTLQDERVGY